MKQNLANLDRDILQAHGRIFQEAFAHGIVNDMIYGGLETGQSAVQAVRATPVAVQNCRIGTRRVTWDGRVYKYGKAIATLNTDFLAQSNSHVQDVGYAAIVSDVEAGSQTIIVTVGGGDGDGSGNISANALAYGNIIIFRGSENSINMQVLTNTGVSGGGPMTITVEEALPALTSSMNVEIIANEFIALKAAIAGDLHKGFVGLPMMPATTLLPFHWEQTWGPCWIAPDNGMSSVNVGDTRENHAVVARYNGTIAVHDYNDTENKFQQHVGFVMSRAQNNTQGAPFVMLQISR